MEFASSWKSTPHDSWITSSDVSLDGCEILEQDDVGDVNEK